MEDRKGVFNERSVFKMEMNRRNVLIMALAAFFLALLNFSFVWAEEYDAMKGVNSANAIFDVRLENPQSAVLHLALVFDTYKELVAMKKAPVFAVVFMGEAVKLISTDHSKFKAEDLKYLKEIAETISKMSKAGIRVEVCLFAVKAFGVEPASILPEIHKVGNGWISEIGYQARGYSLVPVY